jgi:hypothetical protein
MQMAKCGADGFISSSQSDRERRRVMRGRGLAPMVVLLTAVLLEACGSGAGGGAGAGAGANPTAAGFVNQTQHTDAELWTLWTAAQQKLSQQIDMNPLQRTQSNVPPDILPGDPRVWSIQPQQLVVAARPDVASAALLAATGMNRPDPTGLIACPQPCNVSYAAAYSLYGPNVSRYAASWEFAGNNFDALVQYEFENHILQALGYDMTWR